MQRLDQHVLLVGGGFAGLAAAVELSKRPSVQRCASV